jgi:hypothetical protein
VLLRYSEGMEQPIVTPQWALPPGQEKAEYPNAAGRPPAPDKVRAGGAPVAGEPGQGRFFVTASRRIIWNRVGTPSEVVTAATLRTNRVSVAWSSMLAARPARLVKMPGA